jgi:hypothetical protein
MATSLLAIACASRYRLDLFLTLDEDHQRVKVETTQLVMDAVVGNPYADDKVEVGDGNVAVLTFGAPGAKARGKRWQFFGFDENLRCQLYVQIASMPEADSSTLVHRSLLHVLGRYEQPIEERVFLPREGYYIIDSVTYGSIYFTVEGAFTNRSGAELQLNGRFSIDRNR